MSRIGKLPIAIPQGVEVKIDGQTVVAKGPLGEETVVVREEIKVLSDSLCVIPIARLLER